LFPRAWHVLKAATTSVTSLNVVTRLPVKPLPLRCHELAKTFSPELFTKRNHLSQTNISGKKNNLVSVMAGNSSFVIRKLWTEKTCLRKVGVKIGKTARKK